MPDSDVALTRGPRAPLTRARVIATALELADSGGIETLTMRRLGQALGVEAMSLYNHVANKQDVLSEMIDLIFTEIDLPATDEPWRQAMASRAQSMRAALLRHRWAVTVIESWTDPWAARLRHHEAVLGCLRRSGFSIAKSFHAFWMLDSYVYGVVVQELSMPAPDAIAAGIADFLAGPTAADHPYVVEAASADAAFDFAIEFERGLEFVLDGIERTPND